MATRPTVPNTEASFPPYTAVPPPAQAPARRPWPWILGILAGLIIVPLLLCIIASAVIGSAALLWISHQVPAVATASQTYTVSGTPLITVHNPVGNIHILAGPANQVTVQTTRRASDISQEMANHALAAISVTTQQSGNALTITGAVSADHPFTQQSIDLLITTPAQTNLTLDAQAGDVTMEHLTGTFALSVAAGNVIGEDMHAAGASTLTLKAGNLRYTGDVAASATLVATVQAGNADLFVPRTQPPSMDAAVMVGNLTIHDFPLHIAHHGTGASAQGDMAADHAGTLTVRVTTGNITVSASA